ncbi:MAG: hypothetical protein IJZ06_00880 [Bacteroidales bacterium]|nr:hypothetical protein [Bacteroidales bacterium]
MKMLKKDSFFIGVILTIVVFFVLYSVISFFTDYPYFSQERDSLWVYMISLIPSLILSRFMLVKNKMESTGKGMMFTTLIAIVLVMFVVLK